MNQKRGSHRNFRIHQIIMYPASSDFCCIVFDHWVIIMKNETNLDKLIMPCFDLTVAFKDVCYDL